VLDRGRLMAIGTAAELTRRFIPDRYRAWTRQPSHPAFAKLARDGLVRHLAHSAEGADSWSCLEMEIPGGDDRAAAVVEALTGAGVPLARFEWVSPSLADLIQAIVVTPRKEAPDA
jgi:hypothetical protein